MGALKYISYVIFAALFLSIAYTLYSGYQRGAAEREFVRGAKRLADKIRGLGDPDSVDYSEITIPPNCKLSFKDNMVIAVVGGRSENFDVGMPVSSVLPHVIKS